MIFLKPVLTLTAMHCAVLPVDAAFGAQVDCRGVTDLLLDLHAQEEIALAQVTATEARVSFIANPGERMRDCPSAKSSCRLKAFLVPGDDVLVIARDGPYVCATFKSPQGVETSGWLPKAALAVLAPKTISAQAWDGKWRDGVEAEIVLKSHGDEVEVSGEASWGGVHTGELEGNGKPRDRVLAIGYDPDKSSFPPSQDDAVCAARLHLFGLYLAVEDNDMCGGMNVRANCAKSCRDNSERSAPCSGIHCVPLMWRATSRIRP